MKNEIRSLLINTCGWIVTISVVVFFFTLWLFSYNNVEQSLKESWSITFSALSALTTIGAAVIAAYLFNDWRVEKSYDLHKEYLQTFANNLFKINYISNTSTWWFIDFYNFYNTFDNEGDHDPQIAIRKIIEHNYSEVQVITSNINESIEFFTLYESYEYLINTYNQYLHIFSQLCFINEEIEKLYQKLTKTDSSQESVFVMFLANEFQLNEEELSTVKSIIKRLETEIDIKGKGPFSYEDATKELDKHYRELKRIIASKLDIPNTVEKSINRTC